MAKKSHKAEGQLRITLVRSAIGRTEDQKNSVKSLGLRKLHQSVILKDDPSIRGICNKISHLVTVEEVAAE